MSPTHPARHRIERIAERIGDEPAAVDRDASTGEAIDPTAKPVAAGQPHAIERTPLGAVPSDPDVDASNLGDASGIQSGLLHTLGALGLVIALILLVRRGFMKWTGQRSVASDSIVEVLSRTAVAPKNHVLLLRVGPRVLIVADSPQGMRTLAQVHDPDEVADLLAAVAAGRDGSISRSFAGMLNRFGEDGADDPLTSGADEHEFAFDRARDSVNGVLSRIRAFTGGGGS